MNVSQVCQYHGSDLFVQGMYGSLDCASKHFAGMSTEVECTRVIGIIIFIIIIFNTYIALFL